MDVGMVKPGMVRRKTEIGGIMITQELCDTIEDIEYALADLQLKLYEIKKQLEKELYGATTRTR